MLLSADKAVEVFRKIQAIRDHLNAYALAPDRLEISVEDLQWCVADMYGLKIEKFKVQFEADHLRGNVERYGDGRAIIYIRADQSDDWMRFVSVKELCHLVIDEEED